MAAPLFSNTCTHRQCWPSSAHSAHQVSMTARTCAWLSSGSVREWSGEKHSTRLLPRAAARVKSGSPSSGGAGAAAVSAAKSLSKTCVPV